MATTFGGRLRHAWNAFTNQDEKETVNRPFLYGETTASRPGRIRARIANERSIIDSIYNRIAIDVAAITLVHAQLDDQERYVGKIDSYLNQCLTIQANIDQPARMFRQDIVQSLLGRGVIAIVPVDTTGFDPTVSTSFDIQTMRVAEITSWMPQHVKVNLYNDRTGLKQELILPKSMVAIVENPLYAVMNEPNSTLQRLIRKLGMMDSVDEQATSGKLDMIIQLPYVIKSDARREQAEQRRKSIEDQLSGSQLGIAYTDGTEKVIQLNRSLENNMLDQIQYLQTKLYGELGITAEVMNGTADEAAMVNYYNRTIEPILAAITESMIATFLSKTARTQGQTLKYFRDPFRLVPVSDLAEIADKFTRNEILSANEFRGIIGYAPSSDPKADQLINSNMPQAKTGLPVANDPNAGVPSSDGSSDSGSNQDDIVNGAFSDISDSIDKLMAPSGSSS